MRSFESPLEKEYYREEKKSSKTPTVIPHDKTKYIDKDGNRVEGDKSQIKTPMEMKTVHKATMNHLFLD